MPVAAPPVPALCCLICRSAGSSSSPDKRGACCKVQPSETVTRAAHPAASTLTQPWPWRCACPFLPPPPLAPLALVITSALAVAVTAPPLPALCLLIGCFPSCWLVLLLWPSPPLVTDWCCWCTHLHLWSVRSLSAAVWCVASWCCCLKGLLRCLLQSAVKRRSHVRCVLCCLDFDQSARVLLGSCKCKLAS